MEMERIVPSWLFWDLLSVALRAGILPQMTPIYFHCHLVESFFWAWMKAAKILTEPGEMVQGAKCLLHELGA